MENWDSTHISTFLFLTRSQSDVLLWPLGYTGTSGEAVY